MMTKIPAELEGLVGAIRRHLDRDLLTREFYETAETRADVVAPSFGACTAAAGAFWVLAGGDRAGWRFKVLPKRLFSQGPHYFVQHTSGQIVDPTADQFTGEIPYGAAEWSVPCVAASRELVERVLADVNAETAIESCLQWTAEQSVGPEIGIYYDVVGAIVGTRVEYLERPEHVTFRPLPPGLHTRLLSFCGRQSINPTDMWDDSMSFEYRDAPAILDWLKLQNVAVDRSPEAHAGISSDGSVVTADTQPRQGQREVDREIRKFLKDIGASDVRIRRVGHTTYTWLHPINLEPDDTGSDLRWEIRHAGNQIMIGVFDIKPFYRVLQAPFAAKQFKAARKELLAEMDQDGGG